MTKNNEQIIDNLGSEKCVHRAHLGYKNAPYFKKCYSCKLQNHQLEAVQANNTTEYWYKCNTENCLFKKLEAKEQECEKAKQNAQDTYDLFQALIESFNILQCEKIKLERECEELNKTITNLENIRDEFSAKLDQLKAENDELKKENKKLKEELLDLKLQLEEEQLMYEI